MAESKKGSKGTGQGMDYGIAPYNFISLPEKSVVEYETMDELPKHNVLNNELISGTIEYSICALTPLIVGAGNLNTKGDDSDKVMFKNPKGEDAIPGNTMRGLLRSNAAVLSMSNIIDDIEDERFYFRSFGGDISRNEYETRLGIKRNREPKNKKTYSVAENVKSGYLYKNKDSEYVIIPSKMINGKQYYRVGEEYLRMICHNIKIEYMYTERIKELITKKDRYNNSEEIGHFLKNIVNERYETNGPVKVSFNLSGKGSVKEIDKHGTLTNNGWIMSGKYMYGKRAHYIVNEPDLESPDKIEFKSDNGKKEFIDFYECDLLRTGKVQEIENDVNYYTLISSSDKKKQLGIENGKPIFYGEFNEQIYFGFTPYFRIPYDNSIHEGISKEYKENSGISYCESIFGFSNKTFKEKEKISYKTRISVEDAVYCGKIKIKSGINQKKYYNVILGEPKASSYPNYLEQSGNNIKTNTTYNSSKFKIRGIKQYWQKEYIDYGTDDNKNKKIVSKLYPLEPGSMFKGKIHFKNMSEEELGLLLWALKVDESATENIGMGKPYGFGRIKIDDIVLKVEELEKKYSSMSMDYWSEGNVDKYIETYTRNFEKKFNIKIKNQKGVKELIDMKTVIINKKQEDEARYMTLDEYNNKIPLLTIEKQIKELNKK